MSEDQRPDETLGQGAAELEGLRATLIRETRLAAIAQLSTGVAHDLRNPLAVIRNAVFLLKRKIPPDEAKWHEYLDIIEQEAIATGRIISELTALGRSRQPDRKRTDLRQVLDAARGRVSAPESVEWQFAFAPDPFIVPVDPAQWEQVFCALFKNAVQAVEGSGRIAVSARRGAECDEILVTDSGPGVPPEIRADIFEPLFTTKSGASGLGLTVARHAVEAHGGTLTLAESPQGAALLIRLPRSSDG